MISSRNEVEVGLEQGLARLWRFGLVLSGDQATADDLVQATCIRALERFEQFRPGSNMDAWLFSILSSIWRNMASANSVRRGNGIVDVGDAQLEAEDCSGETRILLIQTLQKIEQLPDTQKRVMLLVGVEGFSYSEAAQVLSIPIGTVMSRMSNARRSLR